MNIGSGIGDWPGWMAPQSQHSILMTDSQLLRAAALILRRSSSKPFGFWMNVVCRVLTEQAEHLELAALREDVNP